MDTRQEIISDMLTKKDLQELARQDGACAVGFAEAAPVEAGMEEQLRQWLAEGRQASMSFMERHLDIRLDPRKLLSPAPETGTVIVFAFPYFHTNWQRLPQVAIYAQGQDYHAVLPRRLAPIAHMLQKDGFQARICVDSAPICERYWARRAGVGFVGRNNTLIVPSAGSFVFLAEIVTDAVFPPDAPCRRSCAGCNRCLRACPASALSLEGTTPLDPRRCLSFHTIENRAPTLPELNLKRPVACVFGCDICQLACPHNLHPLTTSIPEFKVDETLASDILAWAEGQGELHPCRLKASAVSRAGKKLLERNYRDLVKKH